MCVYLHRQLTDCISPHPSPLFPLPPPPHTGVGRPTLPELLCLEILEGVGAHYFTFGVLLLNDKTGSRVDAIENMYCRDGERICRKILQEWLEGKGLEPVTWETLVQTLRNTKLFTLADSVKAAKL